MYNRSKEVYTCIMESKRAFAELNAAEVQLQNTYSQWKLQRRVKECDDAVGCNRDMRFSYGSAAARIGGSRVSACSAN